jgi:hypothetical protein
MVQILDAAFQKGLLVFGVLVLGVLGQLTIGYRVPYAFGDLAPLNSAKTVVFLG